MTREEAKAWLEHHFDPIQDGTKQSEAVSLAIKALEQEPCEDAISRSDMLDAVGHGTTYTSEELQKIIKGLPPVNPQPKIGKWIEKRTYMECPHCHDIWHYEENQTERFKCCPTCGERIK